MNHSSAALKVLVVEDDWLVRHEITSALRRAGWRVFETSSGEGALTLLKDGQEVDVLVTDIQLTGYVSGWDLAESVRADWPDMPVIHASGNTVDRARQVPGSLFFAKPCRTVELLQACDSLGQPRASASTNRAKA